MLKASLHHSHFSSFTILEKPKTSRNSILAEKNSNLHKKEISKIRLLESQAKSTNRIPLQKHVKKRKKIKKEIKHSLVQWLAGWLNPSSTQLLEASRNVSVWKSTSTTTNNDDERKEYGTRKQETANEATSLSRCLYL